MYTNMNKPIGATQKQLDDNNIEWLLCGYYGDTQEPRWVLCHSSEYDWAKERVKLLQEIANLKRDCHHLAKCIDPVVTNEYTYELIMKYTNESK